MLQKDPLNFESGWESEDGSESISAEAVAAEMASIGAELAVLQISKCSYFQFFELAPVHGACSLGLMFK